MLKINIEMPSCCYRCVMYRESIGNNGKWGQCRLDGRYLYGEDMEWIEEVRPSWCPLIDDKTLEPVYKEAGIFCGNCSSYIRTCDTFCSSCGRKIEWNGNRRTGE